jgi:hypothetical protein
MEYVCFDNPVTGYNIEEIIEFTAGSGPGSFADGPPFNENICDMCHTQTNHHRNGNPAQGGIAPADLDAGGTYIGHHDNDESKCTDCHPHIDGFAPTGGAPAPPHDSQPFIDNCDYCHITPTDFAAPIPDVKCEQCHTPTGVLKAQFQNAKDVVTHSDVNGSGKYVYTNSCVGCHDPMFGSSNLKLVRTDLSASGGGTNIVFTQRLSNGSFADGFPYDQNVCETCHTATNHHWFDGNAPADFDELGNYIGHNDETDCSGCHPHNAGFLPVGGSCLDCHNQSPPAGSTYPNRRQIVEGTPGDGAGDFVRNSHHVSDGTSTQIVTEDDCLVCHDQSQHQSFGDGVSALLNDQDGGASYTFDGTGSSVEGFCVSCHDSDGSLVNGIQPFNAAGDTNSPPDIGWTAGGVAHSIDDACFNCHGDTAGINAHGSANAFILKYNNYVSGASQAFCYNCHDGTAANTDIQSIFNRTFRHGVEDCQVCHNQHTAEPGTHTPDGQWYPPSPNENTNDVSGVLSSVKGVEPSPWPPSWTTTNSFTVLESAVKEYQICFKCHAKYSHQFSSDCLLCHTEVWDEDLGAIVIGFKFRSAQREFNINNKSAHPVVVTSNNQIGSYLPRALSTTQMESPWTNIGQQTMYCADCHGADDEDIIDVKGPHGSNSKFILKGPNKMWPIGNAGGPFSLNDISGQNRSDSQPLNTNISSTLFCLNCHDSFPSSNNNTWKNEAHEQHDDRDYQPAGDGSDHNVYCIACHAVVPHGNKVSRMLAYRSQLPEYNTVNGINYNILQGFKKTARFNYSKANCWTASGMGCHTHETDRGSQVGGYDQ